MTAVTGSISSSNGITEDEAALYDRQIRLWGVEAQNRMRTSSILVVNIRGIATEVVKNIVLAGVGSVTLMDDKVVTEEDLGTNYFLREEDIGKKRVEAAAPRVQALNPRVNIQKESDLGRLEEEAYVSIFDLVVYTEATSSKLLEINALTRRIGKKLFAASSVGMDGWVFADLLEHEFMVDKIKTAGQGEIIKVPTKVKQSFCPFSKLLEHTWEGTSARAMKKISPGLWAMLVLFAAQRESSSDSISPETLAVYAKSLLPSRSVDPLLLPSETIERIGNTASYEFMPSVTIIGGIVGQDVLNTLGGKEEPLRNFMVFEGLSGAGSVWSLGF